MFEACLANSHAFLTRAVQLKVWFLLYHLPRRLADAGYDDRLVSPQR